MWQRKHGASEPHQVGATQPFVRSCGLRMLGEYAALVCEDGTSRVFAELTADPDRPEVRPQEAYQSLLASLQPGWSLRILQLLWPDPEPRQAFARAVTAWGESTYINEGRELLQKGMELHLFETPLPYVRKVYLEFVYAGEESLAWWGGLPGMLGAFFVRGRHLAAEEIQALVKQAFHPELG